MADAIRYVLPDGKTRRSRVHIISSLRSKHIEYREAIYIEFCGAKYIDKGENMAENKHELREETIEFALEVSDVCEKIKGYSVYTNQLLRSSSSIGANVYEAKYAQSKADFVNKLEIALKESSETEYWIELLYRKQKFENEEYNRIKNKCGVIRRKLIASITTAKKKM
jgi:four helix bundle protein